MLEAVGHPYAVNPDKALRAEASRARLAGPGLRDPGGTAAAALRSCPTRRSRWPRWGPQLRPARPGGLVRRPATRPRPRLTHRAAGRTAPDRSADRSGQSHPTRRAGVTPARPPGVRQGRGLPDPDLTEVRTREPNVLPAGTHAADYPRNGPLVRVAHPDGDDVDARMVTGPEGRRRRLLAGRRSSRRVTCGPRRPAASAHRATVRPWTSRTRPAPRSSARAASPSRTVPATAPGRRGGALPGCRAARRRRSSCSPWWRAGSGTPAVRTSAAATARAATAASSDAPTPDATALVSGLSEAHDLQAPGAPALDSYIASGGHVLLFLQVANVGRAPLRIVGGIVPQTGASRDLTAGGLSAGTSGGGALNPGDQHRGVRPTDRAVPAGARRHRGRCGAAGRGGAGTPPPAGAHPDGRAGAVLGRGPARGVPHRGRGQGRHRRRRGAVRACRAQRRRRRDGQRGDLVPRRGRVRRRGDRAGGGHGRGWPRGRRRRVDPVGADALGRRDVPAPDPARHRRRRAAVPGGPAAGDRGRQGAPRRRPGGRVDGPGQRPVRGHPRRHRTG